MSAGVKRANMKSSMNLAGTTPKVKVGLSEWQLRLMAKDEEGQCASFWPFQVGKVRSDSHSWRSHKVNKWLVW